jgi:hypothetical protein
MLSFAHISTGAATNNEYDIDEMNSRRVKNRRCVADRSRYRNRRGYNLRSGPGCPTFGVQPKLVFESEMACYRAVPTAPPGLSTCTAVM